MTHSVVLPPWSKTSTRPPLSTSYGYDVLGNMARTDLPNGVITAYDYDQLNRLDVMTDYAPDGSASPGSPDLDLSDNQKLAEYDYEVRADGKRTSAKETFWLDAYNYGTPEPYINHINWTYDDIGRLTDEVFNHFDDNLDQTEQFVYDLTGNRISKTVDKGNDGSIEEAITYSYDANDRLLEEVLDDLTDDSQDRTTTYGYDHTQQTSKDVLDSTGSPLSASRFVYDLQGRMAEVTTTEASGKVTVASFEYDATGIRIASTTKIDANGDGTFESQVRTENLVDHHNFTGYQQSIKETHTDLLTGKVIKTIEYTYGHDEIAQTVTEFNPDGTVASETTHIFGHDGHGSVRVLYDSAASILQLYAYSSYGEMLGIHDGQAAFIGIEEALALTILLYSGEPYYQQIAMQYLRARWYRLDTGTFNRLDDFTGNMHDPQSLHKYLYVHGDPVQGVDPSGQLIAASFSVGQLMAAVTFASQVVTFGSAVANGYGAAQSFSSMVQSVHEGRFVEAVISQLKFIGHSIGLALDVFSFLALSKARLPGGGGSGAGPVPAIAGVGGNLAIKATLGATIAANIGIITHVITPIYAAGHLGIIAMSARQNGPWWQGKSSWAQDVSSKGNWEWQAPVGNSSNVDPDLPPFDGNTTFGFFETLGARANIRSGNAAQNVKWFKQTKTWQSLSQHAKIAAKHAEGAGVAAMQRLGLKEGTVRVNATYVCQFCQQGLPELLNPGETLFVFYDGPGFYKVTTAGAKLIN